MIHLINANRPGPCRWQSYPEMRPNLFKDQNAQPRLLARGAHALNPASPLLNEAQFMEDATGHSVSHLRYALPYVLNGKAEWQDAGVLHFDTVIKYGHSDGSAMLCVVSVYDCIGDCLAQGNLYPNRIW